MLKVRFGIIGCGMIANFHAAAIAQVREAELRACFDQYAPGAAAFAEKNTITAFHSLEEMLESDAIDAVSICTPSGMHAPQTLAALRAGKHVVVEKPMSLSLEDADAIIDLSERMKRKVCVISQYRFQDAVQAVKRAIDGGAFGRIVSASLAMKYYRSQEYYASGGWRGTWKMDGGGALMNQGIHGVDVFRYLMGPVRTLTALTKTQTRNIEVEDSAVAIVDFKCGAVGTMEGSTTCYPGYPRRIEICGDNGSVVLEEDRILRWDLPAECPVPVGLNAENVASSDPKAISAEGHIRLIGNFADAVLYDTPLLLDARSGRAPLEIILGVYRSAKLGQPVDL